jgi:hypothetical protein
MFEYFLVLLFIVLFIKPLKLTLGVKLVELVMIVYVSYKNPLLGIVCAAIFLRQYPMEGMQTSPHKPSRIALDEQMRPKNSNSMSISKPSGVPPQESLTGNKAKPYKENQIEHKYSKF